MLKLRPLGHTRQDRALSLYDSLADQLLFRSNPLFERSKPWYSGAFLSFCCFSASAKRDPPSHTHALISPGGRELSSAKVREAVFKWAQQNPGFFQGATEQEKKQWRLMQEDAKQVSPEAFITAASNAFECRIIVIDPKGMLMHTTTGNNKYDSLVLATNGHFYSSCIVDFAKAVRSLLLLALLSPLLRPSYASLRVF
jgi:hypothetical protein